MTDAPRPDVANRLPPRPSRAPGPNEPCWCGSGAKYKKCHRAADQAAPPAAAPRVRPGVVSARRPVPPHIAAPDYALTGVPGPGVQGDPATRLERLRRAGRAAARVLAAAVRAAQPGATTDDVDAAAHAECLACGAYPSPLGYRGYPKSLCTSVNEVVLHGIPDSRPLEAGDVAGLDVTVYLEGMHADCAVTVAVGPVDEASRRLLAAGEEALRAGIAAVRPGALTRDIGRATEAAARAAGLGIVREYCGHGIGEVFHTDLYVPHWDDPRATHRLREGDILTVEPMVTLGSPRNLTWPDGWTVVTADGSRAAHFEHTLLVTAQGAEIITRP
jgi:methionyl aminopeptidase